MTLMPTTEEPATEMRLLTAEERVQPETFDDLHAERAAAVRCVPVSIDGPG